MSDLILRALALAAVLTLASCGAFAAAAPVGPRLATVEMIETRGPLGSEDRDLPFMSIGTIGSDGSLPRRFVRARLSDTRRVVPSPFLAPAWWPDGSLIAFAGAKGKKNERIFVLPANGGRPRALPGTRGAKNPVLSPDGRTLAFSRIRFRSYIDIEHITEPAKDRTYFYASTTTWIVDLPGGRPRRLTRWRNGLSNVPDAFGADGSTLILTKDDDHLEGPAVMSMSFVDGSTRELVSLAEQPALSPDGSRLAFVGYLHPDPVEAEEDREYLATELYVANADGTGAQRLTRSDDVVESSPSWDPSGQRIAYVQDSADTSFVPVLGLLFPTGNALMQINTDGTCREKIASHRKVAFYGAAWQPGPGREAGRIAC